jgi:serine/threonine protein kinase
MLALNYMHARGVIHRDLKLENIMVQWSSEKDKPPSLKLCDFGFACFKQGKSSKRLRLGSPHYMSPEVVQFKEYDDRADVWSLGVITFMCLVGQQPFSGRTNKEIH